MEIAFRLIKHTNKLTEHSFQLVLVGKAPLTLIQSSSAIL